MKNSGFSKCWYRCVRFPACDFAWDAERGLLPPKPPSGSSRCRRADKDDKDGKDAKKDGKDKDHKEDEDERPPEADE